MLRVHNLVHSYHTVSVLNDVSFEIAKGSVVGLMGVSGSGKSTLLRCIQGLDQPDKGTITCQGKIGMLMQDFQLFPHMTVLENITYVPRHVLKMDRAAAEHKACDLLRTLGLGLKHERKPYQLSGGQKQRAALIRALSAQPDLLLCDEPTSALDTGSIQDLGALFHRVVQMGVTLLIASHDVTFLTKITDRFLVLKSGQIKGDFVSQNGSYKTEDLEIALALLQERIPDHSLSMKPL